MEFGEFLFTNKISFLFKKGVLIYELLTGDTPFHGMKFEDFYKENEDNNQPIFEIKSTFSQEVISLLSQLLVINVDFSLEY